MSLTPKFEPKSPCSVFRPQCTASSPDRRKCSIEEEIHCNYVNYKKKAGVRDSEVQASKLRIKESTPMTSVAKHGTSSNSQTTRTRSQRFCRTALSHERRNQPVLTARTLSEHSSIQLQLVPEIATPEAIRITLYHDPVLALHSAIHDELSMSSREPNCRSH